MGFSIDEWIDIVKECKYLPENDFKKLCDHVSDLLLEESNVQPVSTPVTVCGDIHGQFYDLEELFRKCGQVPDTSYVFMGDFVDRGYYSLETLTRLLTLKAKWPDRITLLRGNHESRQITQVYGFYDECLAKYGNAVAWQYCCRVFDLMTIAAIIDEEVLCVHGGLSPDIRTLDQIRLIERNVEIPHQGAFCDLVWSDPEDIMTWATSPRGAGWLFGYSVTNERVTECLTKQNCNSFNCRNDGGAKRRPNPHDTVYKDADLHNIIRIDGIHHEPTISRQQIQLILCCYDSIWRPSCFKEDWNGSLMSDNRAFMCSL